MFLLLKMLLLSWLVIGGDGVGFGVAGCIRDSGTL